MTTLCYQGNGSVVVRSHRGTEVTLPITKITAIGDADIDSAMSKAMETPGVVVEVSSKSYARGVAPRNYAVRF